MEAGTRKGGDVGVSACCEPSQQLALLDFGAGRCRRAFGPLG